MVSSATLLLLTSLGVAVASEAAPLKVLATRSALFHPVADEPVGLEYEILKYYARAHKRTLEVKWIDTLEELMAALDRGEGDLAAGNLTVTPEREERFDFSLAHFPVRVVLVEPAQRRTTKLTSLTGSTFATILDSTLETILREGVPRALFVYGRSGPDLFEAVASGEADALAIDSSVAFLLLRKYPSLRMGMYLSEEQGTAFAVPKGSPLRAALSDHIRKLKRSGIYFRILENALGAAAVAAVRAGRDGSSVRPALRQ